MDQKMVSCNHRIYYGEPPGEVLEEITGKIRAKRGQGPDAVRCKHVRFTGLALESNTIHVPDNCWEEAPGDANVVVTPPRNEVDIGRIADQLNPRNIKFGDFREIVAMLIPEIKSSDMEQPEDTSG
jgi:hypothetical protein